MSRTCDRRRNDSDRTTRIKRSSNEGEEVEDENVDGPYNGEDVCQQEQQENIEGEYEPEDTRRSQGHKNRKMIFKFHRDCKRQTLTLDSLLLVLLILASLYYPIIEVSTHANIHHNPRNRAGHHSPPSICHVQHHPHELGRRQSKCSPDYESTFEKTALAEFQRQLVFSSKDLRNLIGSYMNNFHSNSLGWIQNAQRRYQARLLAERDRAASLTSRSQPNQQNQKSLPDWVYAEWLDSSWRLFDAMLAHLNGSSASASSVTSPSNINVDLPLGMMMSSGSGGDQFMSMDSNQMSVNELNNHLNWYMRRLQLIQAKQLLDQRLEPLSSSTAQQSSSSSSRNNSTINIECMAANLIPQSQVDFLINELVGLGTMTHEQQMEWQRRQSILMAEQTKLTQSIKQSVDYARTLLNSLSLAREMFTKLTDESSNWITSSSCHRALIRMNLCSQCHPQSSSTQASSHKSITSTSSPPQPSMSSVPCEGFCLNVMRGCMNDVFELNKFWSDHVIALTRFKDSMIEMNNIENVMSRLDERLLSYQLRLAHQMSPASVNQLLHNQTNNNNNDPSTRSRSQSIARDQSIPLGNQSTKIRRLCNSRPNNNNKETSSTSDFQQQQQQPTNALNKRSNNPFVGGVVTLPIDGTSNSASESLFNKFDTFVHELQASKSFFATWPERLCRKMRDQTEQHEQAIKQQAIGPLQTATSSRNSSIQLIGEQLASLTNSNSLSSSGSCWNGIDFSGSYTKPLVHFGHAITPSHPEVPLSHTVPFNTIVLNFVAKLKYIGAQLARKSIRSPQMSLLHSLAPETLASLAKSLSTSATTNSGQQPKQLMHSTAASWQTGPATNQGRHTNANNLELHTPATTIRNTQQQQQQQQIPSKSNATTTLEIISAVNSELELLSTHSVSNLDEDSDESGSSDIEGLESHHQPLIANNKNHHQSPKGISSQNGNGQRNGDNDHGNSDSEDFDSTLTDSDLADSVEEEPDEIDYECKSPDCSDLLTSSTLPDIDPPPNPTISSDSDLVDCTRFPCAGISSPNLDQYYPTNGMHLTTGAYNSNLPPEIAHYSPSQKLDQLNRNRNTYPPQILEPIFNGDNRRYGVNSNPFSLTIEQISLLLMMSALGLLGSALLALFICTNTNPLDLFRSRSNQVK